MTARPGQVRAPRRIVIRTPNWLGDAIMALPAMGAVRNAYPDAALAIAAPAGVAPLFEEHTAARQNEVIVLAREQDASTALRAGRFDTALVLPNSFRSAWVAREAGIPERWGYASGLRRWLLTQSVARPRQVLHQAAYYTSLVRGLGIEAPDGLPRIEVRPQTVARADAVLAPHGIDSETPLVGFAPGAAYGHAKRWPPKRVAEVIARLTREGSVCALFGAAGDRDAGREIESSVPHGARVVNFIGRTDLRLLSGLVARCDAFVSNDSGAMHLAAALGVPVTATFGPTDDRVTAPLGNHDVLVHQVFCRPCMLRDCPIDHRCMKGISPEAVHGSVASRLAARARRMA